MSYKLDFDDIVKLIVGARKEQFAFEKALRLHQFKMWILYPKPALQGPIESTRIAAVRVLDFFEKKILGDDYHSDYTAATASKLFNNKAYRSIFNTFINDTGGLIKLIHTSSTYDNDNYISEREQYIATVAALVRYRVRASKWCKEPSRNVASINRSIFFVSKFPSEENISPRSLHSRLAGMKRSAIFAYLITDFELDFFPRKVRGSREQFITTLNADAEAYENINRLFGYYAFISETYDWLMDGTEMIKVPACVQRIEPPLQPFSEIELAVINRYAEEFRDIRENFKP